MIDSKSAYRRYLEADWVALGAPGAGRRWRKVLHARTNPIWAFQRSLRRLEYASNCRPGLLFAPWRLWLRVRFRRASIRLGFTIPPNVFGPGLSISHWGPIVVNHGARVGANCRIHPGVTLGTEAGFADRAPTLGDDCYLGPGAKVFGAIVLADGTAVGANAAVGASVEEPNTAVAGVPARKIAEIDPCDFLIRATWLVDRNFDVERIAGRPAREVKEIVQSAEYRQRS